MKPVTDELLNYKGISACPEDIDSFWNKSIKEMEQLNFNISLERAEFIFKNAEAFHLYFDGVGGSRIHAKYIRPKNATNAPVIFLFHGYSGESPNWVSLMPYVCDGFCVAALDCRGQAGLSEDKGTYIGSTYHGHLIRGLKYNNPEKLLFRQNFLDSAQIVRIIEGFKEVDRERLFTKGVSQGGGLALACAALSPQIKKAAVCYPFLSDYSYGWNVAAGGCAYDELKDYFRNFDPRHQREAEIFNCLGYIDIQNIAKRIKAKVLMFTGLMDDVCPPFTQFAVYNKIETEKKVLFYPDYGHEYLPDSEEIMLAWLEEN